jgi:hypothetical protein
MSPTCHAELVSASPASIWTFKEVEMVQANVEKRSKSHTSLQKLN